MAWSSRISNGSITVEPNPAEAGGEVTIRGDKGETVYVAVQGRKGTTPVKLDANGEAKIKVPVGSGQEFIVSDGKFPKATEVIVSVVSSGR